MVTVIHYDDLTWPEVANLPRACPLVLPLGQGYSHEAVAAALDAEQIILLPLLPYG